MWTPPMRLHGGVGGVIEEPTVETTVGSNVRIYEVRTDEVYRGLENRTEKYKRKNGLNFTRNQRA